MNQSLVAQLEATKDLLLTKELFHIKVLILGVLTFSNNAKIFAPTTIILVSKEKPLAGVTMILKQSLDLDLMMTVVL
jgi:hypothetical protein